LPITDFDTQAFLDALHVNVLGAALVIKHFSGLMKDGGLFLSVTSEAGSMSNVGDKFPVYSITKSAQNKLAAVFAKTVSRFAVYAVHPGRMNTEMGRTTAQIEPEESAEGFFYILTGQKKLPEHWFINYLGEPMDI
jgi:NAD(P)-dependent dehydrogenase (short-subunit alcohol dehydrogenase family)